MNWYFTDMGEIINLSSVKILRDQKDGHFAYFEVPKDGQYWNKCSRVAITKDDWDRIYDQLFPK